MNKQYTGNERLTARTASTLLAGILAANALLFPAITLYLGNIDRFALPLFATLKLVLAAFAVLFLMAFVVLGWLRPAQQRAAGLYFAILSLIFWVQGNFLVWDYGALDGRSINWREFQTESLIDIAVWLGLTLFLVKLAQRRERQVREVAVLIFFLQCAAAVWALSQSPTRLFTEANTRDPGNLPEMMGFSRDRNVLHIVADGFQSDVFQDLLETPELETSLNRAFEGFVYYRETLGVFPYTRFSVPAFLSGKVYSNQVAKNTFIDEVLAGRTIISTGRDNGFDIDLIIFGNYWSQRYARLPYTNIHKISETPGLTSPFANSAMLLDMALFRVTPGAFKIFVYRNQKWLASQLFSTGEALQFKFFSHTYFLNLFTDEMHADRERPVYKYLHIMNTHNPMVVREDCSFSGRAGLSSRYALTLQSICTMDTLARLFDRMRALGIYDSTAIIIHGDHGGWIGNRQRGPDIIGGDGKSAPDWIKSLASPLVAIKPPGASGSIKTSRVPGSLLDLPDTISDIMDWPGNFGHASLLTLAEGVERTRYFRFYDWEDNAWEAQHAPPMVEFAINGSHYEIEWVRHRIISPPVAD